MNLKTQQTPIALTGACLEQDDVRAMEEAVRRLGIGDGDTTRQFEEQFRKFLGVHGAVATNSATSALILALAALELASGDEVIVPTYTCVAVLNAVRQIGATPRLTDNAYDVARMDYNMTLESIRRVMTARTRAIIVPHMFGTPAPVDRIVELGVPVIEDVTLSLGARCEDRPIGSFGEMSVCSFHASKMIACGEGGMLACRSRELHRKACLLNNWVTEQPALRRMEDYCDPYQLRYNFRLIDIAAALGISQIAKLPRFIARRRELAQRYAKRLSKVPGLRVPEVTEESCVFHRYLVAAEGRSVVDAIEKFAAVGIEVGRGVYPPLHRYLGLLRTDFPGAERAVATLLSIPIYPALDDDQVEYLLSQSEAILAEQRS